MNPWRTLSLLVCVLILGGCPGDVPTPREPVKEASSELSQATKGVEKAQTEANDQIQGIDNRLAALDGEKTRLEAERNAALAAAKRAEKNLIERTILGITLLLIFGVAAATVLAVWWQSKSMGLLALAAGAAIPVVQSTSWAIDHPIITGVVVVGGAALTLLLMALKGGKLQTALGDAVSFGRNALGHLERVEPSAAELVKLIEKERQDANKTRGVIKKKLSEAPK